MSKVICFFDFHTKSMRSRYMIATIARIAAIAAQRSLHTAIVATTIAEIEIFLMISAIVAILIIVKFLNGNHSCDPCVRNYARKQCTPESGIRNNDIK